MTRVLLITTALLVSPVVEAADTNGVAAPVPAEKTERAGQRGRADADGGGWNGRGQRGAGSGRGFCDGSMRGTRLRDATGPGRQAGRGGGRR
jgi:hypothetical protein